MTFTIKDLVSNTSLMKEEDAIYVKRIDGKFLDYSEVAILELTEDEKNMLTSEISKLKCPGFEYFLEANMIKDMVNDFDCSNQTYDLNQRIEIIIHYAEFDA